ncbi:hypothetical protein B0G57_113177 [Trinickia symbiotica]|nr:hypothetical protein B0G57_113177 [Trinickia symbiotica]
MRALADRQIALPANWAERNHRAAVQCQVLATGFENRPSYSTVQARVPLPSGLAISTLVPAYSHATQ